MTPDQLKILDYVRSHIGGVGCAPSYSEIAGACGLAAKSAVARHVDCLVSQGRLVRGAPGAVRSLSLPGEPDLTAASTDALRAELRRRGEPERVKPPLDVARTLPCAVVGCSERIGRGHIMCTNHWFMLPDRLRTELMATWRGGQGANYQRAFTEATLLIEREEMRIATASRVIA